MAAPHEQMTPNDTTTTKPAAFLPMTMQQEDSIIHTRITNDEKALRRVTKKFHSYASVAYDVVVPPAPAASSSVDDARDAFLVELASFHLSLKKSLMVCEAEARQVEEYQREKERVENECTQLREQIEGLRLSLEQAQLERRRKMEYDACAEKVNALPPRGVLEGQINALEAEIAPIRAVHDEQNRVFRAQQAALGQIISTIREMREMGKQETAASDPPPEEVPAPESRVTDGGDVPVREGTQESLEETGEIRETDDEDKETDHGSPSQRLLNPTAQTFIPSDASIPRIPSPLSSVPTPLPSSDLPQEEPEEGETEDIEMGELAEEPEEKSQPPPPAPKKKVREELEEGEASDSDLGSELTEFSD